MNPATLTLVPPEALPRIGSFYSLHRLGWPPLPAVPPAYAAAGLPVYWLGGHRYLIDDTGLDWDALRAQQLAQAAALSAFGSQPLDGGVAMMGASYGPDDLWLEMVTITNQIVVMTLHSPVEDGTYDLYFLPDLRYQRWQWRRVLCGVPGQTEYVLPMPDPGQGYFIALDAADDDGDGLGNGYEHWFHYSGQYTSSTNSHSDLDNLPDGWEVQYGLNPKSTTGWDGASVDPDGDQSNNAAEFSNYNYQDGTYDPLSIANRPVVSVAIAPWGDCDRATITFSRYGGDDNQLLTVHYCVGGDLRYGIEYSLTPVPAGLPRIFSVEIPEGWPSAQVLFELLPGPANLGERTRFAVAITPYVVTAAPLPPVPATPSSWAYVPDIHQGHDRAVLELDFDSIRPVVDPVPVSTCPSTATIITLTGSDPCGDSLIFEVVPGSGPAHGELGAITQHGTYAEVLYTPTTGYCGPDEFLFVARNHALTSLPAAASITVGHAIPPEAHCQTVLVPKNSATTITLAGTDLGCQGGLTFAITSPPSNGSLSPVTQHGSYATVIYTPPNPSFEDLDPFDFTVANNCGEVSPPARVTLAVVPPPSLSVECRRNRLLLSWAVPDWVVTASLAPEFRIYRCESTTTGGCTPAGTAHHTVDALNEPGLRFWVDSQSVDPAKHYGYAISFGLTDFCTTPPTFRESPLSQPVWSKPCEPPKAPTDIAFIVDNTASVDSATTLAIVKSAISNALDDIVYASTTASVPAYRLALVTPDNDQVHVRVAFDLQNRSGFSASIAQLPDLDWPWGHWDCESTDECIKTAIKARRDDDPSLVVPSGCERHGLIDPVTLQIGHFSPSFASDRRLAVLLTDRPPGGFCDPSRNTTEMPTYDPGYHGAHAQSIATEAKGYGVKINAIQLHAVDYVLGQPSRVMDNEATAIMQYYATTTCGWHSQIPVMAMYPSNSQSTNIVTEAILRMVYAATSPCP